MEIFRKKSQREPFSMDIIWQCILFFLDPSAPFETAVVFWVFSRIHRGEKSPWTYQRKVESIRQKEKKNVFCFGSLTSKVPSLAFKADFWVLNSPFYKVVVGSEVPFLDRNDKEWFYVPLWLPFDYPFLILQWALYLYLCVFLPLWKTFTKETNQSKNEWNWPLSTVLYLFLHSTSPWEVHGLTRALSKELLKI